MHTKLGPCQLCSVVWCGVMCVLMCYLSPQIREDIRHHGINIYPSAYPNEDDEDAQASAKYEVKT